MANAKYLKRSYLRYLGAAGLVALGCTATSGGETSKEGTEDPEKVYSVDDELHLTGAANDPVLVGRWRLNGSFQGVDDSATGDPEMDNDGFRGRNASSGGDVNDPAIVGGGAIDQTGNYLSFDGAAPNAHDFVSILESSNPDTFSALEPAKVSVEAWIKTTDTAGYIVSKGAHNSCNAGSYALYISGGQTRFLVRTGGGIFDFRESPGMNVSDNAWHHVVGTFDGTTVRLYVDGAQVGTGTSGASASVIYDLNKHNNLYFGAYNEDPTLAATGCQLPYAGALDDVSVWKNALNAAEVTRRFQGLSLLARDDDNDGVPNNHDECPSTAPGVTVNSVGCPVAFLDKDNDGVSNLLDRCDADTTQPMPIAADGCHDGDGDGVSDEPRDGTGVIRDVCPVGTVGPRSARGCSCPQARTIVNGTFTPNPASIVLQNDPCPTSGAGVCYRTHGAYVSCVSKIVDEMLERRVVRFACAEAIKEDASQSNIGKRGDPLHCPED
ncbi:MAG: LamG domain-containing protein [Deltaproteobacteria bacterium]|nr:LamG domain-containing protein [Deltaproteobacteria bacterium]